jgi:hypothetical protein
VVTALRGMQLEEDVPALGGWPTRLGLNPAVPMMLPICPPCPTGCLFASADPEF